MIFIARHGETAGNASGVIQLPDVPLSPTGRDQAQRLAERMMRHRITRILSSDLTRALETASYAGVAAGIAVEEDALLRERDFGELRGTSYASLKLDPFAADYVPPGGESWQTFHGRMDQAWERIQTLAGSTQGHLLVVTHGLFCRALVDRHLSLSPGQTLPLRWQNTSVTEVEAAPPWRVRRLNCAAHLDNDGPGPACAGPA